MLSVYELGEIIRAKLGSTTGDAVTPPTLKADSESYSTPGQAFRASGVRL